MSEIAIYRNLTGGATNPMEESIAAARRDDVRLFHINRYAHPWMDAALEVMLAF
jgi:hypothetical protein